MAASSSRTATITNPAMSTTSAALTAGGGAQVRYIANTTGQIIYVLFGTGTASATNYTITLAAGATYEMANSAYNGPIQGVMATGTGNATLTAY